MNIILECPNCHKRYIPNNKPKDLYEICLFCNSKIQIEFKEFIAMNESDIEVSQNIDKYNLFTDIFTGLSFRIEDNLIQLISLIIGFCLGAMIYPAYWLLSASITAITFVIVSGLIIGIYRAINQYKMFRQSKINPNTDQPNQSPGSRLGRS